MNKLFKRIVSGALTASLVFSSVAFSAFQTAAADAEVKYTVSVKNQGKEANLAVDSSSSPIIVWVNGGKATYNIGTTGITVDVDGKTANVDLTAMVDSDGYNITTGKNLFWGVATNSDGVGDVCYYAEHATLKKPINSLKEGKDEIFKVSAGKVTAGKITGTGYLGIYIENKKDNSKEIYKGKTTYTLIAKIKVDVKLSPSAIALSSDSSGIDNTTKVTKATVALNDVTDKIYVKSTKAGETSIDSTSTYTVKVDDKSLGFVEIVVAGESDGTIKTLPSDGVFQVKGVGITQPKYTRAVASDGIYPGSPAYKAGELMPITDPARADKNATATLTITNNQSGKSTKLSVTVTSGVNAVIASSDGAFTNGTVATGSDGYYVADKLKTRFYADSKTTVQIAKFDVRNYVLSDGMPVISDSSGKLLITQDDVNFTITSKPTVGVFKSMPSENDLISTSTTGVKSIKFNYGTSSVNKGTSTLAIDSKAKNNTIFTLAPKKQNYDVDTVEYAVIAYGPSMDQILIIPFVIEKSIDDVTAAKIDAVTFKTGLSTENTTNKFLTATNETKLTKTATNGLAFTVTTKLGMIPEVTAYSDSGYTTKNTEALVFTNNKVSKIKVADDGIVYVKVVAGGNEYKFVVKGMGYPDGGGGGVQNPALTALTVCGQTVTLNTTAKTGTVNLGLGASNTPGYSTVAAEWVISATISNSGTEKIIAGVNTTQGTINTNTVKATSVAAGTETNFTVEIYKSTTKVETYTITVTIVST